MGTADDLSCAAAGRQHLHGLPVPLIGRVSMDTVTIDVFALPAAALAPGTAFDLIDHVQDINAVAAAAGTNAYDILSNPGAR